MFLFSSMQLTHPWEDSSMLGAPECIQLLANKCRLIEHTGYRLVVIWLAMILVCLKYTSLYFVLNPSKSGSCILFLITQFHKERGMFEQNDLNLLLYISRVNTHHMGTVVNFYINLCRNLVEMKKIKVLAFPY